MPDNTRMERCISEQRGALVFWAPDGDRGRLTSKAQIIDVFSLQVATGFVRDPRGWLLLQAQPSVAAGRTWCMAWALQLIRNDARHSRWVALQKDKHAWGLFWAGGGLQRCRTLLVDRLTDSEAARHWYRRRRRSCCGCSWTWDPTAKARSTITSISNPMR